MSYIIYTDVISSLLDPRLIDLGSVLIHDGAYNLVAFQIRIYLNFY